MAVTANFGSYRGEDIVLTVTMSPVTNITGWTGLFAARKQFGDAALVLSKAIAISDAANGVFTVTIAKADTASLDCRTYCFDIQRTNSGAQTVLTIGQWSLLHNVQT